MKKLLNTLIKKDGEGNVTISKSGITLISLVITIIILIILAGVTINLTIGENGILNKAKYAKQEYLNSQEAEQEKINELYSEMMIATNNSSQITVNVEDLKTIIQQQILASYPVGSIYISTSETNPSEFIGGTWESYGQGRTLVGAGSGTDTNSTSMQFAANTTGGEYTHKLTIAEMPSHTHIQNAHYHAGIRWGGSEGHPITLNAGSYSGAFNLAYSATSGGENDFIVTANAIATNQNTGDSQFHNNIQPYIVTYMWKRVS